MNPFNTAQAFGHGAEEILKFAANAIPGLEDKIKYALAAGYGADEVLKFLQNSFQGKIPKSLGKRSGGDDRSEITKSMGPHEPDPVIQMKAYAKQRNIGDLLDPGRLALQAGGAAAGFAMGGPVGAAAGAYGGTVADEEMLKKYEEHIQEGGQMSFEDYLKSIITGAAKGAGAYVLVDQAKKVLQSLNSKDPEKQKQIGAPAGPDELVPQSGDIDITEGGQGQPITPPATPPAVVPDPGSKQFGPKESFELITSMGQGVEGNGTETMFRSNLSPVDALGVLTALNGQKFISELEKRSGKPALEVVTQAINFAEGTQEAQPPVAQGTQYGIPTEASVEADVLQEMAGGPAGIVPTTQAPVTQETPVTPEEMQSGRNVKRLDMGEGDESFIADVFANVFEPPEHERVPSDKKRKVAPLENALKSSNVRGGQWNKDTGEMRITFQPKKGTAEGGSVYTYPNVDQQTWEDLTGGKATPITEGENIFGFWDRGKKSSIGAAFSAKIKKKADQFPPTQLAEEDITVSENQIRTADRAFMVSDLFEPFKKQRADGRRLTKAADLQEWIKDYADQDPEDVYTMIKIVEEKLESVLKNPPSTSRLKKEITEEFGVTFNPTEKEQEQAAKKEAKKKAQLAKKAAREAAKKRGK